MDRTTRPLVIIAAFAGSLVVGLVIMLWALGGLRAVTAPAAIGGGLAALAAAAAVLKLSEFAELVATIHTRKV